jgi:hypothetical protein
VLNRHLRQAQVDLLATDEEDHEEDEAEEKQGQDLHPQSPQTLR